MAVEVAGYVYLGTTAPGENPVAVGHLWSDTTSGSEVLNRCTSISPFTWVSTEGGSSAHNLDSATHGDVDAITEAKGQLLVQGGTNWAALAVGADGQQLEADSAQTLGVKWAAAGGHTQSHDHSLAADGQDLQPNNLNLGGGDVELTIATGEATVTRAYHSIDTEADAATDNLAGLAGGADGDLVIIRPNNDARTVVVKHLDTAEGTAGNRIALNGDADITLDDLDDILVLLYDAAVDSPNGGWMEVARGGGGGGGGGSHTLDHADHTDVLAITEAKGQLLLQGGTNWDALPVGADDEGLIADADEALGVKWVIAPPAIIKPAVTRYVLPGWFAEDSYQGVLVAGDLYYIPIFVTETITYIRIAIKVNTAVTGDVRLGIYDWSAGLPGALSLDAGILATGTTGAKEITISKSLTRGFYFLCAVADAGPTLAAPNAAKGMVLAVPGISTNGFGKFSSSIMKVGGRSADVAGGLADPAPAPDAINTSGFATVWLKEN